MGVTDSTQSESAVELEFTVRDRDTFFVDLSAREGCRVELEHMTRRSDGRLLDFFTVSGGTPERVVGLATETDDVEEARLVGEGLQGDLYEFVVSGPCVGTTLADVGAVARTVTAEDGDGRVVADVPPHVDVRSVVQAVRNSHARTELVAQRSGSRGVPVQSPVGVQATLGDRLTDKQREALWIAYRSGYFDWPRERTTQECADRMGVSQPTFSQHLRTAEAKVFETFFDGPPESVGD